MIVKRVFLALYLLSLAVALRAAEVPADAGLAEVRSLGLLNGEALACSYPEAASHIKLIIIQRAPISRRYGDAFELATKEAYLGKIREGQESCPKVAALTSQADELATRLQAVVSPEAPKQQDDEGQSDVGIIPRYLLMDTKGQPITQQNFPGKFQLIAFGYTFCPDICPTTLAEMTIIMGKLGNLANRLQPIFVSVDPERDTPEKLAQYTAFFDPRIVALTGSPELVRHAANNFKVRYEKHFEPGAAPDKYSVDHSAGMYLLGPDGRYLGKFAYRTPPTEAAERIKVLMDKESQ